MKKVAVYTFVVIPLVVCAAVGGLCIATLGFILDEIT